ncbi:MAG: putative secreted Zn-dependent protease [Chloroflexi bacterium]|jgi:predicted secreted Zn-dependent protease|nr:MAG: putative secreted Zn-dependent protease [Chloroflexota bacterium]
MKWLLSSIALALLTVACGGAANENGASSPDGPSVGAPAASPTQMDEQPQSTGFPFPVAETTPLPTSPLSQSTMEPTATLAASGVVVNISTSFETVYYTVNGQTTEEIFDSVRTNGPEAEVADGHFAAGLTENAVSFQYAFQDGPGYCQIESVNISLDLTVTLPRHAAESSLSAIQSGHWRDFEARIAVHEQRHVDIHLQRIAIFKTHVESLPVRAADCNTLENTLTLAWRDEKVINDQAQDAFHQEEALESEAVRTPLLNQISQHLAERDRLQVEIDSVSLELERLRSEITNLGQQTQPLTERIADIQAAYPDLTLPPDVFTEYSALQDSYNAINDQRDFLVDRLNSLVNQHNKNVAEFNRLTALANTLTEDLNWLP